MADLNEGNRVTIVIFDGKTATDVLVCGVC